MELLRWSAASGGPSVCFPVWHRRGGIDKGQVLSHVQSIKLKQEHGKLPNKSAVELILMTVGSAFMVGWPWDMDHTAAEVSPLRRRTWITASAIATLFCRCRGRASRDTSGRPPL